jgi:hypothetical protein
MTFEVTFSLNDWRPAMMHFSCDRCQRPIDSTESLRYVVHMDIRARIDGVDLGDEDDQDDTLMELDEILACEEERDQELIGSDVAQQIRLDLCPACYKIFIRNPLGRRTHSEMHFSEN